MRRIFYFVVLYAMLMCSGTLAQRPPADSQRVSIESVSNSYFDTLIAGRTHEVRFRVQNKGIPLTWKYSYQAGFRVYSPDGALYGPIGADTLLDSVTRKAYLGRAVFPNDSGLLSAGYNFASRDGEGSDTIYFFGVVVQPNAPGLAANFDQIALSVKFTSRKADSGKTICIDSSFFRPSGRWIWVQVGNDTSVHSVAPNWGGGRCFTVSGTCCRGNTGNVDCDGEDLDDLIDLTRLVDYLFISFAPLCCPGEADMNLDSMVDIGDLTVQIDHMFISFAPLPVCSGL